MRSSGDGAIFEEHVNTPEARAVVKRPLSGNFVIWCAIFGALIRVSRQQWICGACAPLDFLQRRSCDCAFQPYSRQCRACCFRFPVLT